MSGHLCLGNHHKGHDHGHHHGHSEDPSERASSRMRFAFWINFVFAVIELVGGVLTNSMAIVSDAVHDFGDSLAIGLSWWLEKKSRTGPDSNHSYGHRRYSVLGAMIAALIVLLSCILIVIFSVPRLLDPQPVIAEGMLGLAVLGVAVNFFSFLRLHGGGSLHERILKWHFVEDMTGWILVLIAAALIWIDDRLTFLDPLLSILLAVWIFSRVFKPLMTTLDIFLQAFPASVSKVELETALKSYPEVQAVHHTHLWSIDEVSHVLTTHVMVNRVLSVQEIGDLKRKMKQSMKEKFGILDATIELEFPGQDCSDPEHPS